MRTDGPYKLAMPTAKQKGGSASHRYRPASEYDDATLVQKRQYWRTKKREQRARLTERRVKTTPDSRGGKLLHVHAPAEVNSTLSGSFATFSSPLQSSDNSYKTVSIASQSGNTAEGSSAKAAENQRERWLHSVKLNRVLPASRSISAKAATVKCSTTRGAVSRAVTSATPSGPQLNTRSSVPPARLTRTTNGSSAKPPQPCVSMQGASVPRTQQKAQVTLGIQPKLLPTNVTTGMILVSSPCVPVSIKTEGKTANASPQSGTKSALVTLQRAKGVSKPQSSLEPEEERAAKRREQWRIKKREQRAKLAKARERTQSAEMTARKTGAAGGPVHLPAQSFLRGAGRKQCPAQVRTTTKRENDKLQCGAASLVTVNLQAERIKVQNLHGSRTSQTAVTCDVISVRKPGESQRVHLSNVTRGIARCKTPRQRFIEAQRTFTNQRNTRCKSPLLTSVFGNRNIPQIDPNDTPEQIVAKRREYWRIKKREQRAKLSMEMKARLKEKDALMRRAKRYHSILEEMRRARALAQSTGSTLRHASETIGGFIKEDGTVTINIPQGPTDHIAAAHKSEEERHVDPNNTPITKRATQPPPALRPAQVKVSFPLAGQSVSRPPALLSIRTRTQLESTTIPNSHKLATQTVPQLTLTHPQTAQNAFSGGPTAGSNLGGCVMKMAVSSSAPSLSALCLDPELTEEERMAKKREYWRIKKREQRAARAARLRQGVLQARAHATLQRRRAQKLVAVSTVPLGRGLANRTGSAQPLPNNSRPVTPHANEIKRESESMPAVDLHSQPEQAICPDIKAPTSPPPPPPPPPPDPQPEPDPALSADSQATTLLAVASMKKLLEESLSTVTECSTEQQTNIKTETTEEASEQEVEPRVPLDELAPVAADLTLEIKSWQSDSDTLAEAGLPSPALKRSPQSSDTFPPFPTSNRAVLHPTCEHSSQTPSSFIGNPSDVPASPRRTPRLHTSKADHQSSCSPEPPKLHHLPMDQHQGQAPEQSSAQGYVSVVTEHSSVVSLQRKREYWKLMKRQQRARLRARQRERQGDSSKRSSQASAVKGVNGPVLLAKPSSASLTAVTSIPTVLLVSPAPCSTSQSPDTLQVKVPVTSVSRLPRTEPNHVGPSPILSNYQGAHENPHQATLTSKKWMTMSADVDPAPSLPTLKPPDNPLSSINLQPIEPLHTPNTLRPIKIPCAQLQSPAHVIQPPVKLAPLATMVPPKPIPGEREEDFLKRKREYWRIKKKEQRARKAIQDKGLSPRRASSSVRPILPAHEPQTQVPGQWVSSSDESDHLMSTSEDTDPGSFSFTSYTAPFEDDSELLFAGYEGSNGEEDPVSDGVWRNRYLMDYDPLNQLLVCMVCGELQYSHSLEGVRAHIDEAHPDTLTLEPREQQRILEAWDEQVSQRERFFTSQLQQHSGALAEAHGD